MLLLSYSRIQRFAIPHLLLSAQHDRSIVLIVTETTAQLALGPTEWNKQHQETWERKRALSRFHSDGEQDTLSDLTLVDLLLYYNLCNWIHTEGIMQMSHVFVHLIELSLAELDKYRMGFLVDTPVMTI